jgi:hypothetical protein
MNMFSRSGWVSVYLLTYRLYSGYDDATPFRFSAYIASKTALDAFSRCIASEVSMDNISISTVYMPLVQTKMVVSKGNKYDHVHMLSRDEACMLIERAIVTKERKRSTATGRLVELGYAISPPLIEGIMNVMYKLEPEEGKSYDTLNPACWFVFHYIYFMKSSSAPAGKENTESAAGNKEQLKALGTLLKGGI